VIPDLPPNVVLTSPGKDVSLPANGILQLEGSANDDFGIKNLTLHLKVLEGDNKPALEPKPYRPGKSLQLVDGSFPDKLAYHDFLALDQLKTAAGQPLTLTKGTVLEYWLEAADNCDFPNKLGNIGKSGSFKISILVPADEKNQKDERKKAQDDQQ